MSWGGGKVIVNTDKREMDESRVREENILLLYKRKSYLE